MRLIAGKYRGRKLLSPPSALTRPTSDRARESIFNILTHHPDMTLSGARVMDAFAGSGAMGLEALSRGAAHVTFIEKNPAVLGILRQNIALLAVEHQTHIIGADATTLERIGRKDNEDSTMDLIFIDPPYQKDLEILTLKALLKQGYIHPKTLILLETSAEKDPLEETDPFLLEKFNLSDIRTYGAAKFYFLHQKET